MAATLKVALIEESGVGKSSIFDQFTRGIINPYIEPTSACNFDKKQ